MNILHLLAKGTSLRSVVHLPADAGYEPKYNSTSKVVEGNFYQLGIFRVSFIL